MNIQSSFTVYTAALHALILNSLLLAYFWLGLSWIDSIDSISANKRFSSSKTSSRKPYSNSKQQEKQKHSAETTINFSGAGAVFTSASFFLVSIFSHPSAYMCLYSAHWMYGAGLLPVRRDRLSTLLPEKFIVVSALCFASPAACCWCRVSCRLFLEMKSFCFDEIQSIQDSRSQ